MATKKAPVKKKKAPVKKKSSAKAPTKKKAPVKKGPVEKLTKAVFNPDGTVTLPGGFTGMAHSPKGSNVPDAALVALPLSAVRIAKGFNPRGDVGDLKVLTAHIKKEGQLYPIIVRPTSGKPGSYDLVAGERRYVVISKLKRSTISCCVRLDLAGADARAMAVAIADNSDELDTQLNSIELGRGFAKLLQRKWSVMAIAEQCGFNHRRVRRCLELVNGPKDLLKKVAEGKYSERAALAFTKLDKDIQTKIKDRLRDEPTEKDIREAAKSAARDEGTSGSSQRTVRKKGKSRDASLTTWKSPIDKRAKLAELAYSVHKAHTVEKEAIGGVEYHELRGALAWALWDLGEFSNINMPPEDAKECKTDGDRKTLKRLNTLIAAHAKNHTPEPGEE